MSAYGRFPSEFTRAERHFFLDDVDRALIEPERRDHNKLGFAVQLAATGVPAATAVGSSLGPVICAPPTTPATASVRDGERTCIGGMTQIRPARPGRGA